MARGKKEMDSELNLISFVSLLSVLICSLLLTAIWVHIGSMDVKQAIGGQGGGGAENKKPPPAVWANLSPDGGLRFVLQDFPRKGKVLDNRQIPGVEGKVNVDALVEYMDTLRGVAPSLRTILVQPKAEVVYEEIISLMDNFKDQGFIDLGVVPL